MTSTKNSQSLFFRTSAKVESLFGRELITNNSVAIYEVIKNAYDARATGVNIKFLNFSLDKDDINFLLNPDSRNSKEFKQFTSKIIYNRQNNSGAYVEIEDNGKGMSFQEIEDYWMELGTSYKEGISNNTLDKNKRGHINQVYLRAMNGEKGIGRFGVDKIGSTLILKAIDKRKRQITTVTFDWNKFDDRTKLIEDIECNYTIEDIQTNNETGVTLVIKNLRDDWTLGNIFEIKENIKKFLSPIPEDGNNFQIYIYYDEQHREKIINDSFKNLKVYIDSSLQVDERNSESNIGKWNYKISHQNEVVIKKTEQYSKATFGNAKARIYYLDQADKRKFTEQMGVRTSDFGNIKIFRDNFRVMPYGEPSNDWLGIDRKHAQKTGMTFGTRDIVGYIIISNNDLKTKQVLREATDRVGLIEDVPEFENFKNFAEINIEKLQDYWISEIKSQTNRITENLGKETIKLKEEMKQFSLDLTRLIKKTDLPEKQKNLILKEMKPRTESITKTIESIDRTSTEANKVLKVYEKITATENLLLDILHAIRNKLKVFESILNNLDRKIESLTKMLISKEEVTVSGDFVEHFKSSSQGLRKVFNSISGLISGSLNIVSSNGRKKKFNLIEIIKIEVNDRKNIFEQQDIKIKTKYSSAAIFIMCIRKEIDNVIGNLFDNAIKALTETKNKIITIEVEEKKNKVFIYFSDNGKGILKEHKAFIFTLFSSKTEGTGIGLAIAHKIIKEHEGDIYLTDNREKEKITTFCIELPTIVQETK